MPHELDIDLLATMVRRQRGQRGLREAAADMQSVSPSTLSRVENGKMPDMETFLSICDWLNVSPAHFFKNSGEQPSELDTPDSIAMQLRADKHLDPATAHVLATLVKAAYRDFPSRDDEGENGSEGETS